MSKLLLALLTALVLAIPAAGAERETDSGEDHAGHHPPGAEASGQKGHDPVEHLRANLNTMQDLLGRIRDATDPAEKRRLLRVHMLAMQEQIRTIRSASAGAHDHGGGGSDAGAAKGGDAKKDMDTKMGAMMGGGMMKMHKKMEQRLDALEQLLEQLIEHEAAEDSLQAQ